MKSKVIKILMTIACVSALIYIMISPTKEEYARMHAAKQDIRRLDEEIREYKRTTGHFVETKGWFASLKNVGVAKNSFLNRVFVHDGVPIDPWGNPYLYKYPGQKKVFDLISYGADGKIGGYGEDSDISN
jgi:general secretion pathway protein G